MKKYTANSMCAKCGRREASSTYKNVRSAGLPITHTTGLIERKCGNCAYVWFEHPLDAELQEK